jgi:hypothetical protein
MRPNSSENIPFTAAAILPDVDPSFGITNADLAYCMEPLSDRLSAAQRTRLAKYMWIAVQWYRGVDVIDAHFGRRAKMVAMLEKVRGHAAELGPLLDALHPEASVWLSMTGQKADADNSTFSLLGLRSDLQRIEAGAALGVERLPRGEGGQPKELLRRAVRIMMRGLHEMTGEWVKSGRRRGSVDDPHLRKDAGEVIERFFRVVDRYVTPGSLRNAVEHFRAALKREHDNPAESGELLCLRMMLNSSHALWETEDFHAHFIAPRPHPGDYLPQDG